MRAIRLLVTRLARLDIDLISAAVTRTAAGKMPGRTVKVASSSIPPEKLLRALLLQALFTVRSERQLMQQITYNVLFRWFVGLAMDAPVWDVTLFTKNRDLLLAGEIARRFLAAILADPSGKPAAFEQAFFSGRDLDLRKTRHPGTAPGGLDVHLRRGRYNLVRIPRHLAGAA